MVLVSLASQQHWPCACPCLPRMPLSSLWVWPRPGLEGAGGSQSTLPTLPIHWDFQGTIVVMGCLGTAQASRCCTRASQFSLRPPGSAFCTSCVAYTTLQPLEHLPSPAHTAGAL